MKLSPPLILKARAEARARLFDAGDYDSLDEAIQPLLLYCHLNDIDQRTAYNIVLTAFEGRSDPL